MMKKNFSISAFFFLLITSGCKNLPNLGNGYKLDYDGMYDLQIEDSINNVIVDGHILDYSFDSIFIIAAQRPRDSVPGIKSMTLRKYDKAFKKSTFRQYWIIDKTKKSIFDEKTKTRSNVYGPYKKEVYLAKKKELGVPDNLKLKSE